MPPHPQPPRANTPCRGGMERTSAWFRYLVLRTPIGDLVRELGNVGVTKQLDAGVGEAAL